MHEIFIPRGYLEKAEIRDAKYDSLSHLAGLARNVRLQELLHYVQNHHLEAERE